MPCDVTVARFSICDPSSSPVVACGLYDKSIQIYPFGSANVRATLTGSKSLISSLVVDKNKKRLVAGTDSGVIRMWNVNTTECVRSFEGHRASVASIDVHSSSDFVASCSTDGTFRIWDMRKKGCVQTYQEMPIELTSIAFSPTGRMIACGGQDGKIRIADLTGGKQLACFNAESGAITSTQFHPQALYLIAGSESGAMTLWNLERNEEASRTEPVNSPCYTSFTSDSAIVASKNLLRSYSFNRAFKESLFEAPWKNAVDLSFHHESGDLLATERGDSCITMHRWTPKTLKPRDPSNAVATSTPQQHVVSSPATAGKQHLSDLRRVNSNVGNAKDRPATQEQKPVTPIQKEKRASIPLLPAKPPAVVGSGKSECAVVDELLHHNVAFSSIMQRRLTLSRMLRAEWGRDQRYALDTLQKLVDDGTDMGIVVDFLAAMQALRVKERIGMDTLPLLLSLCVSLLSTKKPSESSMVTALRVVKSMNTKFRSRIDEALHAEAFARNGVDLSMEERIATAKKAQAKFDELHTLCSMISVQGGDAGEEARVLLNELPKPLPEKKPKGKR